MSTFGGKVTEIPHISIDNFNEFNMDSEIYFLSHCHLDHMRGLRDNQEKLKNRNIIIYASEVSCHILKNMYPYIKELLKKLDMHTPTTIQVRNELISVTPIPAGHCPGSVMFLFENSSGSRILYTGDYRINPKDYRKIKSFYGSTGNLKPIDKIYLDTTFFLRKYRSFPTRDESLSAVCKIIKEWLEKDEENLIKLYTPARYGYEFLYLELYKALNMPIHLSADDFNIYKYFPNLDCAITVDGDKTRIHKAWCGLPGQICKWPNPKIKEVSVTAKRWKKNYENGLFTNTDMQAYVCYSTHASLEEGSQFIKFLKPKCIEPCVLQVKEKHNSEMLSLIEEHLRDINEISGDSSEDSEPELFTVTSKVDTTMKSCISSISVSSENESFVECSSIELEDSICNSPPRKILR